MTSIKLRPYGTTISQQIDFSGEHSDVLAASFLAGLKNGWIWGDADDLHITVYSDELARWVEVD